MRRSLKCDYNCHSAGLSPRVCVKVCVFGALREICTCRFARWYVRRCFTCTIDMIQMQQYCCYFYVCMRSNVSLKHFRISTEHNAYIRMLYSKYTGMPSSYISKRILLLSYLNAVHTPKISCIEHSIPPKTVSKQ